ncbi:hypothetical protein [Novosphingobium sp.]|uniref:hypothetical protein n=1 Tax=Novosphingobium sp. TaxID=1874826 RepID=UPI0025EC2A41|nr:hypothetical protein [Novosphingobium sp.]MCC6925212.1 hypothetical protein [Novosphingobium sp.]
MIKGRILLGIAVLALGACGKKSVSVEEFEGPIDARVEFIADGVNKIVPRGMGKGLKLVRAEAQGRVLVLALETTLQGELDKSETALITLFRPQVCSNPGYRSVVDHGGLVRFRIARTKTGETLPEFTIAACG